MTKTDTPHPAHPGLLRLSGTIGPRQLRVWRRPPTPRLVNLDQWVAVDLGDRIRIVVADAAYNRLDSDPTEPAAAAAAALTMFEADSTLLEAAGRANDLIHRLFAPLPVARLDGRPIVCVAAADLWPDGKVDALRVGDCEVWVRGTDGHMVRLLGGDWLTPRGQDIYQTDIAPTKRTDRAAHLKAHDRLADPSLSVNYPLGFSEALRVQTAQAQTSGRVAVASDGWDLGDESPLVCFDARTRHLSAREGSPYPHGDLSAVELF